MDLTKTAGKREDYLLINPSQVPALLLDDILLTEGGHHAVHALNQCRIVICAGAGGLDCAIRTLEWLNYVVTELA